MDYNKNNIERRLKSSLSEHRFKHTMGVVNTAVSLAAKHGEDICRVEIAALLHDCAKAYSEDEQLKKCRDNKIELTETEENNLHLIHSKLGVFLAKNEYGVEDSLILNAIRFHTTGKPDMNLIEKIVFVADYIEPGRDKAPNLEQLRRIASDDIDDAVYYIMRDTLLYLYVTNPFSVDDTTKKAFDYYKKIFKEKHDKEEI